MTTGTANTPKEGGAANTASPPAIPMEPRSGASDPNLGKPAVVGEGGGMPTVVWEQGLVLITIEINNRSRLIF